MNTICALALSLVIDVSQSIDSNEYRLQMQGLADAFRNDRVIHLIDSDNPVAINVVFFETSARIVIPWVVISSRQDVYSLATRLESIPHTTGMFTNVNDGVRVGLSTFNNIPCQVDNYVMDVSGDGPHNTPDADDSNGLVEEAQLMGVRINTLPILTNTEDKNVELFNYYNNTFAVPTGGFTIRSTGFDDFARAILLKLTREIAER